MNRLLYDNEDLRNFDLNLLYAFKLLMEERSVSRAAEKMFISQPAMSHILQRLRSQLNDPVLVKTTRNETNLRALALLQPIQAVLKEVEQILQSPEKFFTCDEPKPFCDCDERLCPVILLPKLTESINKHAPNIEIQFNNQLVNCQKLHRGRRDRLGYWL